MVHIPAVYGEWVKTESVWQFEVDNNKGGRMLFLRDGCTHVELLGMVQEDYMLEKETKVELSYPLPPQMLQQMPPDSPPMYVTNDRHVQSLIELSKMHGVRLCVSSRIVDHENDDVDGHADTCSDAEEDWDEDAEDWDENVKNEDEADSLNEDEVNQNMKEKYDDSDVDYSEYGKVKDEDEVEGVRERCGGFDRLDSSWSSKIFVNQSFPSKEKLVSELRLMAVMKRFAFKVYKSTTSLFVAKCSVKGCVWMVRAGVKNEANTFWVTKYLKDHTCSVIDRSAHRRRCTPKYIGALFVERVGIIDGIVPKHIRDSMKVMFGLNLSYTTSYRALIYAQQLVRGTAEDGYEKLPSYLRQIERANPGSVTDLVCDEMDRFKYLFISFGASIAGFQYLRRVIVVDGTHLTGKYGGVLLVAAAQDGNFQIFPLAFGIVDSECNDSWNWFFTKLSRCFSDGYPLVLVSDRHDSIADAFKNVIPWATRGICYYHLQQNIVTKFHGKQLMYLVKGAAYAHTTYDYNRYMDAIREVNPRLAQYLETADPRLWSRVHFPGDRYNIKTSNIAESINAAVKEAKGFPITFLLEFIRTKLGRWYHKRREDALSLTTSHTRGVEYLLAIREYEAGDLKAEPIDGWRFFVKGGARDCIVDLQQRKCSCGVYDVEKIPCSHVIAAAEEANVKLSTLVCPSYSRESLYAAYSHPINPPISDENDVKKEPCGVPVMKIPPGRKKKSRWQTWLEMSRKKGTRPRKMHKQYSCSKCKQPGHTRPYCVS